MTTTFSDIQTAKKPQGRSGGTAPAVAHLVLKPDWPLALCGATVSEQFGDTAPGLDRCPKCLQIAASRGLGRPGKGWA